MLLIADMVYSKKCKKIVKEDMIDSVFRLIGDLSIGKNVILERLGGEQTKVHVMKYRFLEDRLLIESQCTRYEFTIVYS